MGIRAHPRDPRLRKIGFVSLRVDSWFNPVRAFALFVTLGLPCSDGQGYKNEYSWLGS
jgi:hypothetical protein